MNQSWIRRVAFVIVLLLCFGLSCAIADENNQLVATGELQLNDENGLGFVHGPLSMFIKPGEAISISTSYSGDYEKTRESIEGFEVRLNGYFYHYYAGKDFSCMIPQNIWANFFSEKPVKIVLEVYVRASGGSGYLKRTIFLDPSSDWSCEHEYALKPFPQHGAEYKPCSGDDGHHYLSRCAVRLVCRKCGFGNGDEFFQDFTEEDAPFTEEHHMVALEKVPVPVNNSQEGSVEGNEVMLSRNVCQECNFTDLFYEGVITEDTQAMAEATKIAEEFRCLSEDEAYELLEYIYGKDMSTKRWTIWSLLWPRREPKEEVKAYFDMLTGQDSYMSYTERDRVKREFLFAAETLLSARSKIDRDQLNKRIENLINYVYDPDIQKEKNPLIKTWKQYQLDKEYEGPLNNSILYGLDAHSAYDTIMSIYTALTGRNEIHYTIVENGKLYMVCDDKKSLITSTLSDETEREALKYFNFQMDDSGWYKYQKTPYAPYPGDDEWETVRFFGYNKDKEYVVDDADFSDALFILSVCDADKWNATLNSIMTMSNLVESNEARMILENWQLLKEQDATMEGTVPLNDHNLVNMEKEIIRYGGSQLKRPFGDESIYEKLAEEIYMIEKSLQ